MSVNAGEIDACEIRGHVDRTRLTNALGSRSVVEADLTELFLCSGDAFLLCSDGFWEWIVEKRMCRLLKSAETPDAWLSAMESAVLKNGKGSDMDNYSAVAVFIR